jgi:hypothetical protein
MNVRRIVRRSTTVAAFALLPVALCAPARADDQVRNTAGASACSGYHCYYAVLTANLQPIAGRHAYEVVWSCQATSTVDAISTAITTCSVKSVNAPEIGLPGPFAATGWNAVLSDNQTLQLCVGGQSVFVESALGAIVVAAPTYCESLALPKVVVQGGGIGD